MPTLLLLHMHSEICNKRLKFWFYFSLVELKIVFCVVRLLLCVHTQLYSAVLTSQRTQSYEPGGFYRVVVVKV